MHVYEYLISCHPFNSRYWCIGIHWKKSNPIYNASQMNCIKENLNYHQILHVISYTRIIWELYFLFVFWPFCRLHLRSLFISPYTCYVMSSTTCVSFKPSQTKARTFRHMMMYILNGGSWRLYRTWQIYLSLEIVMICYKHHADARNVLYEKHFTDTIQTHVNCGGGGQISLSLLSFRGVLVAASKVVVVQLCGHRRFFNGE